MLQRLLLFLTLLFLPLSPLHAAMELGLEGAESPPHLITDIYLRNGVPFLAVKDILEPLGLRGEWDTRRHLFRIQGEGGEILLSPASRYLRCGGRVVALKQKPRFIDEKLRVPEEVVTSHLPKLLGLAVIYRPATATPETAVKDSPPPSSPPPTAPIRGLRRIIIDPGHGGADPGGLSADGVKEKDLVLAIARRLEHQFKRENDLPVIMTRDGDYAVPQSKRTPSVDGWPEENLILSLHLGAWPAATAGGGTIFVPPPQEKGIEASDEEAVRLAEFLAAALRQEGLAVHEVLRQPLLPFAASDIPAAVIELGYLTNPDDLALLRSEEGQTRIARALYQGVRNYGIYLKEIN